MNAEIPCRQNEGNDMSYEETFIEGRNAVTEALRAGKPIDKLYILDGCQDGPVSTIKREARKKDIQIKYVNKERLDQLSTTGHHQGVIARSAAYEYADVEQIMNKQHLDEDAARAFIEKRENERAAYYNYYTGKKWGDASSYDLCIDSSVLGLLETEKIIAQFIRKRFVK